LCLTMDQGARRHYRQGWIFIFIGLICILVGTNATILKVYYKYV
jgi:1,4-dihydroxy-2-naphthoate octaprenyltransferase